MTQEGRNIGRLTTHVLDTARGVPAAGLRVELFRDASHGMQKLVQTFTNSDGRADGPLLEGADLTTGGYELIFHAAEYLRGTGQPVDFLDRVPVRFSVIDAEAHYHVPLLLSPFGYSTYRGS